MWMLTLLFISLNMHREIAVCIIIQRCCASSKCTYDVRYAHILAVTRFSSRTTTRWRFLTHFNSLTPFSKDVLIDTSSILYPAYFIMKFIPACLFCVDILLVIRSRLSSCGIGSCTHNCAFNSYAEFPGFNVLGITGSHFIWIIENITIPWSHTFP